MAEQYVAKISDKGQITIPKKLRERYGLKEGDYLLLLPQGQGLRIEKAAIEPLTRFRTLAEETERRWQEEGVKPEDIEEAVHWARSQK